VSPSPLKVLKVGLSSVLATAVDIAALVLLVELLGSHVTIAAFLAASVGGATNFLVNKYWAFADRSRMGLRQIASYVVVSLVTAVFVAASVHIFAVLLGVPYLVAKAIAAILAFLLWSYPAQSRLVFRGRKPTTAEEVLHDLDEDDDLDLAQPSR
jgi:putative flippase GtrA